MSEKIKNMDNTQHTTVSVQADNLSKTDSPRDLDLKWIVSPTPHQPLWQHHTLDDAGCIDCTFAGSGLGCDTIRLCARYC